MKIAIIGYGKMGKAIESVAVERGHEIVLKTGRQDSDKLTKENLSNAAVAIEFTSPESAFENIRLCIESGVPVISGTTGWTNQLETLVKLCQEKNGCFIYASNFSVGVNLFFELNKKLAELMANQPAYDVTIQEIHHTQKKDAPSGTAITLADQVLASVKRKNNWVNGPAAKPTDLSIESIRQDPAPGTHSITYTSAIDDIRITHTAHNRQGFATGAVLAAEFAKGRNGFFTMKDVLQL